MPPLYTAPARALIRLLENAVGRRHLIARATYALSPHALPSYDLGYEFEATYNTRQAGTNPARGEGQ